MTDLSSRDERGEFEGRGAQRVSVRLVSTSLGLPAPESRGRKLTIHVAALVAIVATAAYLAWRIGFTFGSLWIAIPLWLLELHALFGLTLFAYSLWDLDSVPPAAPLNESPMHVAVLIPTYNEPREVLLPTIAAAVAMESAHDTWVLDDGCRQWVNELASSLGARYLTRMDRSHAKAGNINNALDYVGADLVAVLDADHVPLPGFLTHTLGYSHDPQVAVVQTPQDFYNANSFEHDRNRSWFWPQRRDIPFSEQRLFYRAIQPGKNRWDAAFWCGTSAVIRVKALRDVGGVADETVTEDIHTTIRMHRKGWRTVYHNEVLARGLAARDAEEYQSQRIRWGTGAMQLLHAEHPLTGPGLRLTQRVAYAATILGWFDGWRTLGYVLVPVAVLLSGAAPIVAPAALFLIAFGSAFLLQRLALALLSRGYAPLGMATLFEFVRLQSTMWATLSYLRPGERGFHVTDKEGARSRHRTRVPWVLWLLLGLSGASAAWFVLTLLHLTPVSYAVPWVAYGAAFWMVFNACMLAAAIARIRSDRFASDRRSAVRHRVEGLVVLDGHHASLVDISMGGALVRTTQEAEASVIHELQLRFHGAPGVVLEAEERSRQPLGTQGWLVGLQFGGGQDAEVAHLAVALFDGAKLAAARHVRA